MVSQIIMENEINICVLQEIANFYSILYCNCEIWLSQGLNARQKQQILSALANALKILNNMSDIRISFIQLHSIEKRALPMNFAKYRLALQIFQIYNGSARDVDGRI